MFKELFITAYVEITRRMKSLMQLELMVRGKKELLLHD